MSELVGRAKWKEMKAEFVALKGRGGYVVAEQE